MTDSENVWCYLDSVLDRLWYENDYGDPLYNNPGLRDSWEELAALLTDWQKRCIAHWLVAVLKSTKDLSVEVAMEVDVETDRIEHMLEKYWNACL